MARRRRNYARDRRGRFARTTGRGGVYKKKMSTRKKIAIAGAGAVAVGAAVVGTQQAYRAGARKGWEVGKAHGVYEGKPLRGAKGRIRPNSEKRDVSRNPYSRGYRPVAKHNMARRTPGVKTRIRATKMASYRPEYGYSVRGKKLKR